MSFASGSISRGTLQGLCGLRLSNPTYRREGLDAITNAAARGMLPMSFVSLVIPTTPSPRY